MIYMTGAKTDSSHWLYDTVSDTMTCKNKQEKTSVNQLYYYRGLKMMYNNIKKITKHSFIASKEYVYP